MLFSAFAYWMPMSDVWASHKPKLPGSVLTLRDPWTVPELQGQTPES